jgi:hypothetical protein
VSERTLRNWRDWASREKKKQGRPGRSDKDLELARIKVFELMKRHGSPGWRPIAAELKGVVSVRLVQKYVAEFKQINKKKKSVTQRIEVEKKNVIWSIDGAFTKKDKKIEHQVIKDRGSKIWIAHKEDASKTDDVIGLLEKSACSVGLPLVLSSDNGSAYKSKELARFMRRHKVVHLMSLPRTPQHNGAVEVGIKELREIMNAKEVSMYEAIVCANDRLREYGKEWSSANVIYESLIVPYTGKERANFYKSCARRLRDVRREPLSFRERRMKEREVILDELKVRGYIKRWKLADNRI